MIAALTARANAIKMMHARVRLLIAYLESLPPEDPASGGGGDNDVVMTDSLAASAVPAPTRSHVILRQILSLVGRLPLLVPSDLVAFRNEILREENDVGLVSLVNQIIQSVHATAKVGKKFAVVELARNQGPRHVPLGMNAPGGIFS